MSHPVTPPVPRVTLSDIARRAGVSRQVVSAICGVSSGSNVRFSPATRERVMKIVAETRFRANRTAKNLVRKRHGAIGILLVNFGHMPEQVLRSMLLEAHARGQLLVLDTMLEEETELPVFLREDSVDGLVVFEDVDRRIEQEIRALAIPCVRVNTNVRTGPGCITFDEVGAMRLAAQHLYETGRRRLGIVGVTSGHYSGRLRVEGLEKAGRELGLREVRAHTLGRADRPWQGGEEAFAEVAAFLQANRDLDGVVLSVDSIAPVFYRAAASVGLRIPHDIAVVGVNNSPIALGVHPALTSLSVDPRKLGRQVVAALNDLIAGAPASRTGLKMEYGITVRGSTGGR